MPELKVASQGVRLEGPGGSFKTLPVQAFPVTISSGVIGDLIRSVNNGEDVQLSLGSSPTIHYGSQSHVLQPTYEDSSYELYVSKPFESTRLAQQIEHTMAILNFSSKNVFARGRAPRQRQSLKPNASDTNTAAALAIIRSQKHGLAGSPKHEVQAIGVPPNKASTPSSEFGVRPSHSPNLNPQNLGAQGILDRMKQQRLAIVHELAAGPKTQADLASKFSGSSDELVAVLKKISDFSEGSSLFKLNSRWYKELDVWNYSYENDSDRQKAIDNAVVQYDKLRTGLSDPLWQKLLPVEERNMGKCLSKVQVKIANNTVAPKIKVTDDAGAKAKDDASMTDGATSSRPRGESMSRSSSNPLPAKSKKSAADSQAKRLLSTSKKTAPKAAPAKTKEKAGAKAKVPLSAEYVVNSDSDEEVPLAKKTVQKATAKTASPAVLPASKSAARPPAKAVARPVEKPASNKRPREEAELMDDSSSSSGTPLSKRLKTKGKILPRPSATAAAPTKHRPSDSSQNSRATVSSTATSRPTAGAKTTTSPAKSSPLASSPPTNASDFDQPEDVPRERLERETGIKRRKVENTSTKDRNVVALSSELIARATSFKTYYRDYEALHYEISEMADPPEEKLLDLHRMRRRLENMKKDIYSEAGHLA